MAVRERTCPKPSRHPVLAYCKASQPLTDRRSDTTAASGLLLRAATCGLCNILILIDTREACEGVGLPAKKPMGRPMATADTTGTSPAPPAEYLLLGDIRRLIQSTALPQRSGHGTQPRAETPLAWHGRAECLRNQKKAYRY